LIHIRKTKSILLDWILKLRVRDASENPFWWLTEAEALEAPKPKKIVVTARPRCLFMLAPKLQHRSSGVTPK